MCIAHTRRPEQQDILLLIKRRGIPLHRQAHVLEMIAQRHAQHLLRLPLPDDKPVWTATTRSLAPRSRPEMIEAISHIVETELLKKGLVGGAAK